MTPELERSLSLRCSRSEAGSGRDCVAGPFTGPSYTAAASLCSSPGQGGLELGVAPHTLLMVLLLILIVHLHLSLSIHVLCDGVLWPAYMENLGLPVKGSKA